jgi:hypothetical protein
MIQGRVLKLEPVANYFDIPKAPVAAPAFKMTGNPVTKFIDVSLCIQQIIFACFVPFTIHIFYMTRIHFTLNFFFALPHPPHNSAIDACCRPSHRLCAILTRRWRWSAETGWAVRRPFPSLPPRSPPPRPSQHLRRKRRLRNEQQRGSRVKNERRIG